MVVVVEEGPLEIYFRMCLSTGMGGLGGFEDFFFNASQLPFRAVR